MVQIRGGVSVGQLIRQDAEPPFAFAQGQAHSQMRICFHFGVTDADILNRTPCRGIVLCGGYYIRDDSIRPA
jgi:hypothetical protein